MKSLDSSSRTLARSSSCAVLWVWLFLGFALGSSAANLVLNPGFESGTANWAAMGSATLSAPTTLPHTGSRSGLLENRTQTWEGISQSMLDVMQAGVTYNVSVWVRLVSGGSQPVLLTFKKTDDNGDNWTQGATGTATSTGWTQLSGSYTLTVSGTLTELTIYIEGPAAGVSFYADDFVVEAQVTQVSGIRLNTLGYLPSRSKKASIASPCTTFSVLRTNDNSVAFSGTVTGPVYNSDTGENLYTADFSALTEQGDFVLDVPGVGTSAPFRIADDAYRDAFHTAMLGMYLWRCGTGVSANYNGQLYSHAACHTNDAYLDYVGGGHVKQNSLKGWHDAGDYNKYTVNAGVTVGCMFRAWDDARAQVDSIPLEMPESGGSLPDYLAELKWELDWLLTMQAPDGTVYHKVSTTSFGGFIMPEAELADRYFVPYSTAATADFVAMMCQASRSFRPYDSAYADTCLAAASNSYAYLVAHTANHDADQSGFSTGGYSTTDSDDRLWAAAEFWEATGSASALSDVESRIGTSATVDTDFDWGNVRNLGTITYLLSERPGRNATRVNAVRSHLISVADGMVSTRNSHGYNRPLGTSYYWGCNGSVARQAVTLLAAYRVSPKPQYLDTALDALNYLFGRNYNGRSFVTGLGYLPPMHPHDRRSGADGIAAPWPGYLVGGGWPAPADWEDVEADYEVNEIAINWNAGLIAALAPFANPGVLSIDSGWYRFSPAVNDLAALHSPNIPPADGDPAQEYTWNDTSAQHWAIEAVAPGVFRISPEADLNSCLQSDYSVAAVTIKPYTGGSDDRQLWTIANAGDGSFRISPAWNSALSLSVSNEATANGTPLIIASWSGTLGQRWYAGALTVSGGNTPPALNPLTDSVVNPGQTVAFTASAMDTDTPSQTLTFSLLNPPAYAAIDPSTGHFSWRPHMTQADSTNVITVKVTDNGFPSMSATQSCVVTVNPIVSPTLSSVSFAGDQLTVSIGGLVGPDYTLFASTNLVDWEAVLVTNSPAVLPFTWTDPNPGSLPTRFYRANIGP
jgi:endoglucanase